MPLYQLKIVTNDIPIHLLWDRTRMFMHLSVKRLIFALAQKKPIKYIELSDEKIPGGLTGTLDEETGEYIIQGRSFKVCEHNIKDLFGVARPPQLSIKVVT